MSVNLSDFNIICRICLVVKENMVCLTNEIYHMIEECTSEQELYRQDKFPQQICPDCLSQLKNSYHFKQQYVLSLEILYNVVLKTEKSDKDDKHNNEVKKKRRSDLSVTKFLEVQCDSKTNDNVVIVKDEFNDTETSENQSVISHEKQSIKEEETDEDKIDTKSNHSSEPDDDDDNHSNHSVDNNDDEKSVGNKDESPNSGDEFDKERSELAKSMVELLSTSTYKLLDLTCNICNRKLATRFALVNHIKTHIKNRPYKHFCTICLQGFYCTVGLNKHMQKHEGKAEYRCEICSKDFYELRPFAIHNSTKHNTKPVQCTQCDQEFLHPLQLERHERRVHRQKEFICDICGKKCARNSHLKLHRAKHSDERPFSCTHCGNTFKLLSSMNKHIRNVHTHVDDAQRQMCSICGKSVKNLKVHLIAHEQTRNYKCPVCLKMYKNKYFLNNHIKEKHPSDGIVKKYYCPICNKALAERSNLAKHMACVHETEKKHGCSFCGKKYKLKSHVNKHIRTVHMDERPHACTICKEAFFSKFILRNHMVTHTGERPFACNTCGKTFGTKGVLVTHMKVHSK